MRSAILLAFVACTMAEPPSDTPEPHWPALYVETWEKCGSKVVSRPARLYGDLRFYRMPGESFPFGGRPVLGAYHDPNIYLSESVWDWDVAVRHEMLHAQYGQPGHPPIFATCDSLV